MPRIELIPQNLYNAMDPYHWDYDNKPIESLNTRISLVNSAVDENTNILISAIGSAGTLDARLSVSLQDSGALKTTAVDTADHNIAYHTDGSREGDDTVYVRMTDTEREKLEEVSEGATALMIQFQTVSTTILLDDDRVEIADSSSIQWTVDEPDPEHPETSAKLTARTVFSADAAHDHYYNLTPVHANVGSPDYQNYKTTSVSTAFIEDSLRICINGISINEDEAVYVPDSTGPDGTWTLTTFTAAYAAGTFLLNRAITTNDVIKIEFNVSVSLSF